MDRPLPNNPHFVPKEAELVFKGEIFDVYQWQQEMFDGSVETFEMLKRPNTVRVIAIDGDQIVTLEEEQPGGIKRSVSLPAGRMDPTDESPLKAAQRELVEETGLVFADWTLLEVKQPEPKIEWFIYTYVAQTKTGEQPPQLDAGEKIIVGRSDFVTVRKHHAHLIPALIDLKSLDDLKAAL